MNIFFSAVATALVLLAMSQPVEAANCAADATGKAPIKGATVDQFAGPDGQVNWKTFANGLLAVPVVAACLNGRTPEVFLEDLVVNNGGVLERSHIAVSDLHAALAAQQGIYLFKLDGVRAAESTATPAAQPARAKPKPTPSRTACRYCGKTGVTITSAN